MREKSVSVCEQKENARQRRDEIVLEHMSLVKAVAIRVHETLPVHVDLDDLIHAGVLGLFDAVEKFDAEKNVVFQTYAKYRIATLNAANRYAVLWRVQTAKKPETRARRIAQLVAMLAAGQKLHP